MEVKWKSDGESYGNWGHFGVKGFRAYWLSVGSGESNEKWKIEWKQGVYWDYKETYIRYEENLHEDATWEVVDIEVPLRGTLHTRGHTIIGTQRDPTNLTTSRRKIPVVLHFLQVPWMVIALKNHL